MQTVAIEKKRKSERLSKDELKALKAIMRKYNTTTECAEATGISRQVLDRIVMVSSGSPESVAKIRMLLSTVA